MASLPLARPVFPPFRRSKAGETESGAALTFHLRQGRKPPSMSNQKKTPLGRTAWHFQGRQLIKVPRSSERKGGGATCRANAQQGRSSREAKVWLREVHQSAGHLPRHGRALIANSSTRRPLAFSARHQVSLSLRSPCHRYPPACPPARLPASQPGPPFPIRRDKKAT
ncbi:hypothetical protein GQ53DRAFT_290053 [Thozetella sp. PMI_491]|nr:hypothetical protein GQ53DRAFT_290053 [Thozetella sp. PMI_491]